MPQTTAGCCGLLRKYIVTGGKAMKNLIDRYVFDVVRRLPEGERGDVERELRANIRDMLPEDSQEAETVRVLESLGDPRKLAEQYRANPRYLISPAMFEQY